MRSPESTEVYSPREIAQAAGVSEAEIVAAIGRADVFLGHAEAVRIGRSLMRPELVARQASAAHTESVVSGFSRTQDGRTPPNASPLFSVFNASDAHDRSKGVPFALSSTLHASVIAAVLFVTSMGLAPSATTLAGANENPLEDVHLVFLATPGPGGGGGGGGLLQPAPAPKARRSGASTISSPVPLRKPPPPIEPAVAPPEPKPAPLNAEPLPVVAAPIASAPAGHEDRVGILQEARAEKESHGPGSGGGAGTGAGTGLGEGNGAGVGPGSDAGIGGGPYRPGSGIEPPRIVREVKADYTEDARRRSVEGDVILEIVVKRDGSVGNIKVLQGLEPGLNDRAVQAVRQWRFDPARRLGSPVDVVVEVAVEFKLR